MLPDTRDTIAAVATPSGTGGIGIVRVSGPHAHEIFRAVFRGAGVVTPRTMHYGHVVRDGDAVDEVLAWFAPGPHTFTGEDIAELQGHGGRHVLSQVLAAVVAAGARPAQPGEFSRRAYLNGRLDLAEAEAVADLIAATTDSAARAARDLLDGALSTRAHDLRKAAIGVLAEIEAAVDYPEEPIAPDGGKTLSTKLGALARECTTLGHTFRTGRLLRDGARVALVGRPNVGKSSLLNALTQRSRSIVTEEAGTTRDVVEAHLDLGGIPVTLLDTAGMREVGPEGSAAEAEGVRRSQEAVETADLVVLVLDATAPDDTVLDTDVLDPAAARVLRIYNKIDLDPILGSGVGEPAVSAVTGEGLDGLRDLIAETLRGRTGDSGDGLILTHARHHDAVIRAGASFAVAAAGIEDGASPELPAADIRAALSALGEITGETTPEDVLDVIFSRFCIGK